MLNLLNFDKELKYVKELHKIHPYNNVFEVVVNYRINIAFGGNNKHFNYYKNLYISIFFL